MPQPPAHPPVSRGDKPSAGVVSLRILATCAVIVMLRYAAAVLLPAVVAVLLFYMLDPIVTLMARARIPRGVASPVVVGGLVASISLVGVALWPQLDQVVTKVPAGAAQVRRMLQRANSSPVDSPLERVQAAANAVDSAAAAAGGATSVAPGVLRVEIQQPLRASSLLWSGSVGLLVLAGQAVAVLFLTIFLLSERDGFKRKLVGRMDARGSRHVTVQILNDITAQIGRFLWVQFATSCLVAAATAAALWAMGLENPVTWGVMAGIMNVVPYFGAIVVTGLLATIGLLQFGNLVDAAVIAGVSLAITSFEGMFLTPHLLSRAASLNHVAVFLAIAFWSWTWGVPGMLLAVPMLMVVKAVTDHVGGLQGLGTFLGREPAS